MHHMPTWPYSVLNLCMHKNASECNASKNATIVECIIMHTGLRMQQTQNAADTECIWNAWECSNWRMQQVQNARECNTWMHEECNMWECKKMQLFFRMQQIWKCIKCCRIVTKCTYQKMKKSMNALRMHWKRMNAHECKNMQPGRIHTHSGKNPHAIPHTYSKIHKVLNTKQSYTYTKC